MKVTRELQRDKLNSDGLAPIRLVVSWEGKRLRIGTGCLVDPAHWDKKLQLVQVRPGTQHSSINPRLTGASEAPVAAATIDLSPLFLNNSLDKTSAQVEVLTKRVQRLEAQARLRP